MRALIAFCEFSWRLLPSIDPRLAPLTRRMSSGRDAINHEIIDPLDSRLSSLSILVTHWSAMVAIEFGIRKRKRRCCLEGATRSTLIRKYQSMVDISCSRAVPHLIIDFLPHEIVERRHRVQHAHVAVLFQQGLVFLAVSQEHENSVRYTVRVCTNNTMLILPRGNRFPPRLLRNAVPSALRVSSRAECEIRSERQSIKYPARSARDSVFPYRLGIKKKKKKLAIESDRPFIEDSHLIVG